MCVCVWCHEECATTFYICAYRDIEINSCARLAQALPNLEEEPYVCRMFFPGSPLLHDIIEWPLNSLTTHSSFCCESEVKGLLMKLAIQVTAMGVKVAGSWGGIGSMANETQVTPMGRREGCLGSVLLCPVLLCPVLQGYQAIAIQSHSDLIQYICSHQHFNIASTVSN